MEYSGRCERGGGGGGGGGGGATLCNGGMAGVQWGNGWEGHCVKQKGAVICFLRGLNRGQEGWSSKNQGRES